MSPLQREQFRNAFLRLMLNHLLDDLGEHNPKLLAFLRSHLSIYEALAVDDLRANLAQTVSLALSAPFSPNVEIDEVLADVATVSKWLEDLLVAIVANNPY
jgi:hypothetical protein